MIFTPCGFVGGRAAIIDVETTGLNPRVCDVLQLAIVDAGTGDVVANRFYDSRFDSWPEAEAVNGISKAMVSGRPMLRDEAAMITAMLGDFEAIVGYNVGFDLACLRSAGVEIPRVPVVDLMRDFSEFRAEFVLKRHKLSDACAWAGTQLFKAHDAVYDSLATRSLYLKLREAMLE